MGRVYATIDSRRWLCAEPVVLLNYVVELRPRRAAITHGGGKNTEPGPQLDPGANLSFVASRDLHLSYPVAISERYVSHLRRSHHFFVRCLKVSIQRPLPCFPSLCSARRGGSLTSGGHSRSAMRCLLSLEIHRRLTVSSRLYNSVSKVISAPDAKCL